MRARDEERMQVIQALQQTLRFEEKGYTKESVDAFLNSLFLIVGGAFALRAQQIRVILGHLGRGVTAQVNQVTPRERLRIAQETLDSIDNMFTQSLGRLTKTTRKQIINETLRLSFAGTATIRQLQTILSEKVYGTSFTHRAETLARTVTGFAAGRARQDAYERSKEIEYKIWISSRDHRVRDEHRVLDGTIVPKSQAFPNGVFSPPEEINCRCVSAGVVPEQVDTALRESVDSLTAQNRADLREATERLRDQGNSLVQP